MLYGFQQVSGNGLVQIEDAWLRMANASNYTDGSLDMLQSTLFCCGFNDPTDSAINNCTFGKNDCLVL